MEKFINSLLEKSWSIIVDFFKLCLKAWEIIRPYILRGFSYCLVFLNYLKITTNEIYTFFLEKYQEAVPVVLAFYASNHNLTIITLAALILMLFFWLKMLRHAWKNEPEWRKTWVFLIIILGPLGAIIYLVRKRYLEKKLWQHNKVMLSFFKPMRNASNQGKIPQ